MCKAKSTKQHLSAWKTSRKELDRPNIFSRFWRSHAERVGLKLWAWWRVRVDVGHQCLPFLFSNIIFLNVSCELFQCYVPVAATNACCFYTSVRDAYDLLWHSACVRLRTQSNPM